MKFGLVKDDVIICEPFEYDRWMFADMLNRRGCLFKHLPDSPTTNLQSGNFIIMKAVENVVAPPSPFAYTCKWSPWVVNGDVIERTMEWVVADDETRISRLVEAYRVAVQGLLDTKAKERGYDNIFTAITYIGDDDPTYSAEAAAFKSWRSACWRQCETIEQAGTEITIAEVLAQMPELILP